MKASIAIQVLPKTDSEEELIRIVDEVIAYIKSSGLNCYVNPVQQFRFLKRQAVQPSI